MVTQEGNLPLPDFFERPNLVPATRYAGSVALSLWRSQRTLFVSGPHASGKSFTVNSALGEGFAVFDLGPLIRKIHQEQTSTLTYDEWVSANETAHGYDFTSEVLSEVIRPKIKDRTAPNGAIIIGNRSISGIEYFKRKLQPADTRIVYFEATLSVLHERYRSRENQPELSTEAFKSILEKDSAMGLETVRDHADYVIDNSDGFELAQSRLQEILSIWEPIEIT
jgi:dephospho-CoA kinase